MPKRHRADLVVLDDMAEHQLAVTEDQRQRPLRMPVRAWVGPMPMLVQSQLTVASVNSLTRQTIGSDDGESILGSLWDHTLCASDLRFCERLTASTTADSQRERLTAMLWGSSGRRFNSCLSAPVEKVSTIQRWVTARQNRGVILMTCEQ